jgi:hypothetical protein
MVDLCLTPDSKMVSESLQVLLSHLLSVLAIGRHTIYIHASNSIVSGMKMCVKKSYIECEAERVWT